MTGAYQSPRAQARVSRHSRSNQPPARRSRQGSSHKNTHHKPTRVQSIRVGMDHVVHGHHLTRLPQTSKPSQTTETTLSGMPWNARLAKFRAKHVTSSYKTGFHANLDLGVDERRSRKPKCRSNGTGTRHPAPDTPFTHPEVTSPRTRPTAVPTAVQQDPEPDAKPLAVMKPVLGVAAACQRFSGAFGFGKNDASPKHLARGVDDLNRLGDEPALPYDPNPVRGGKPGRVSHESLSGEDCEEYFHSADFAAAGVRGATSIAAALDDIDCRWALSPLTSLETESLSGEEHGKVTTNMSGDDFESNAYGKTNCSYVHDKSARTPEPFASLPRRARLFATRTRNTSPFPPRARRTRLMRSHQRVP
jgi:hypothetical protein